MSKKPNHRYYLEFTVCDHSITPQNPELFDVEKGENRYETIYRYKTEYLTKKICAKASDIDRFTVVFPCKEALIEYLFQKDGVPTMSPNVKPSLHFYKYKNNQLIVDEYFDILYQDDNLYPILDNMNDYGGSTLYTDSIPYQEYCDRFEVWIHDDYFRNEVLRRGYIGKKMTEAIDRYYNGTRNSLYWPMTYMRNYHILRGVHCAARQYFPELKEEIQNHRDEYFSFKDYFQKREEELLAHMTYFEKLRYTGEIRVLKEQIISGTLSFEGIPLHDDSTAEYLERLLSMYKIASTEKEKKNIIDYMEKALKNDPQLKFSNLQQVILRHPEDLQTFPSKTLTTKDIVKNKMKELAQIKDEKEKTDVLDEILDVLEQETNPNENEWQL